MKKQKKNFKTFYENSVFSKGGFYVKISLIILFAVIFLIIFISQKGYFLFEYYPYADSFSNSDFQVHFISVGNGDAILIKLPNDKTMMIDTGDDYYSNQVVSYIKQYFWNENLNTIDYLVLTHPDSDHVGGGAVILDKFKVENVYRPKIYSKTEYETLVEKENYKVYDTEIYDDVITKAYDKNCKIMFNEAGINFQLGGARIEFLSPIYDSYSNSNNYSAVIRITYQSKRFLFMGDASKTVENDLIDIYEDDLKADVLKVGHHGSDTSSSYGFLKRVKPEYAVLSCKSSEYYPSEDVITYLGYVNSNLLSTGIRGSFVMTVANDKILYADAEKNGGNIPLIFTIFILLVFLIWENPIKKIKPLINKVKND